LWESDCALIYERRGRNASKNRISGDARSGSPSEPIDLAGMGSTRSAVCRSRRGALHGLTSGTVGRYRARDCTEGSIEFIRECRYVAGLDRLARVNKFLILQEME
jgi:hypothetical protein